MTKKIVEQSEGAGTSPPKQANLNTRDDDAGPEITPLEYMLRLLCDETASKEDRKWAAYHAAPFCHSKMTAVENAGDMTLRHEDALDALD